MNEFVRVRVEHMTSTLALIRAREEGRNRGVFEILSRVMRKGLNE